MTGKNKTGATWHHTTVVLQPDLYRQALEQRIDISDACNRALASLTGSEYHPQQQEEVTAPPPVIIVKDGAVPHISGEREKAPFQKLHPVINADDPAAPARIVQVKAPVKKEKVSAEPPAVIPVPPPAVKKETPAAVPAATMKKAEAKKDGNAPAKKKTKGDALKKFFSLRIARTDDAGDHLGKDELYELFTRFCRDHRITPAPERKTVTVALKNQFALTETMVDGTACWSGIRLK